MILREESHVPMSVSHLSVAYGGTARTPEDAALWDASATVRKGAMTAIVGPNGAGKSTLLNAALGLVPRLAGDVQFFGQPFAAVRERIAYLPQRESIDRDFPLTALEVVRMGAVKGAGWWLPRWARPAGAQRETEAARAALDRVGMLHCTDRPIGDLSGGEQQRVFLARALAQDADLLLLDEPTAGVDAATDEVIFRELAELTRAGKTVVCVYHDLGTVAERFDDVILVDWTIRATGSAKSVVRGAAYAAVFGGAAAAEESIDPLLVALGGPPLV